MADLAEMIGDFPSMGIQARKKAAASSPSRKSLSECDLNCNGFVHDGHDGLSLVLNQLRFSARAEGLRLQRSP
jgi:hypothetical protein